MSRPFGLVPGVGARVPESHRHLLDAPPVAALSVVLASGYPMTSAVWCDLEPPGGGDDPDREVRPGAAATTGDLPDVVRISTMLGFAKERAMRREPRVAVLGYDPAQPSWYVAVRGTVVEMTEAGAAEHLDALAGRYVGRPVTYFGDVIPAEFAATEHPVLCRVRADRVVAMAAGPRRAAGPRLDARADAGRRAAADLTADVLARNGSGTRADADVPLPASHLDLLERPVCGVLTTIGPGGAPESSLVWVDHDGACPRAGTTLDRRKARHVLANPKVSLLVVDPASTGRFLQVRGDAELVADPGGGHVDALARRHTGGPYYGGVVPAVQRELESRVVIRIHPRRVQLDAIHA